MARPKNPEYEYLPDSQGRLKPYVRIRCEGCGEEAIARADGSRRFCSKSCAVRTQHAEGRSRQAHGSEHYAWKGSDAKYQALHMRVIRARGSASHCEWRSSAGCRSRKYEWSHIHGANPSDVQSYRSLCKTCHQQYDGQTGADHANSKLTSVQIAEIRQRYSEGAISQQALAVEYGVHQTTISKMILGRTYH